MKNTFVVIHNDYGRNVRQWVGPFSNDNEAHQWLHDNINTLTKDETWSITTILINCP